MILVVSGTRDPVVTGRNADRIVRALAQYAPMIVFHGAASGVDRFAADYFALTLSWTRVYGLPYPSFLGNVGGMARNGWLLDLAQDTGRRLSLPVAVAAFPGAGPGTVNMIGQAKSRGLCVDVVALSAEGGE